jgi:hypothetical protein
MQQRRKADRLVRGGNNRPIGLRATMRLSCLRTVAAALGLATLILAPLLAQPALAQSADPKGLERQQNGDAGKETQKKADEFVEAQQVLGGPASNPECVWLGRRVVSLLFRDDLDTAFRHLDLYDRFGCPSGHIQVAFRCLLRQGNLDPKTTDTLNGRVHSCWINPAFEPSSAAAPAPTTSR